MFKSGKDSQPVELEIETTSKKTARALCRGLGARAWWFFVRRFGTLCANLAVRWSVKSAYSAACPVAE